MPRYFFHVSGISLFNDTVGAELKDDHEAWSVAVASCGEILTDIKGKMPNQSEVRVTVKNGDERVVAVVRFTGERPSSACETTSRLSQFAKEGAHVRVAAAIDLTLDWIKDIHDPEDYGPFAPDLALAALKALDEGDLFGNGLVVRRETLQ